MYLFTEHALGFESRKDACVYHVMYRIILVYLIN